MRILTRPAALRRSRILLPRLLAATLGLWLLALTNLTAQASGTVSAFPDLTEEQQVLHVLNRLGYGPRPGDIDRVTAMGIPAYIERQLHPERIPNSVVDQKMAGYTSLHLTITEGVKAFEPMASRGMRRRESAQHKAEERERAPPPAAMHPGSSTMRRRLYNPLGSGFVPTVSKPRQYELYEARLIRAVHSERQLQEMLVDFWMNHFNVQFDLDDPYLASDYEERVIRPRVLGRFEDLLVATATAPAMLLYLDNWLSAAPEEVVRRRLEAGHPVYPAGASAGGGPRALQLRRRHFFLNQAKGLNENFGRELMELHTLGTEGGYTEEDVIQVARAFTGWTLSTTREDGTDGTFVFDPLLHEEGDKVVLGRTIPAAGIEEGRQILTMLAHHPSTAHFISAKLVQRFVADEPPPEVIAAAAGTFERTGGDIREVLRTIFTHPDFLAPQYYQGKIKKPIEVIASSMRAVNGEITYVLRNDNIIIGANQYRTNFGNRLEQFLIVMGEPIYQHEAPDGFPDVASAWVSTNALYRRMQFAIALASGQVPAVTIDLASAQSLFRQLSFPEPTPQQIALLRSLAAEAGAGAEEMGQPMMAEAMMPGPATGAQGTPLDEQVISVAIALGSPQFQKR